MIISTSGEERRYEEITQCEVVSVSLEIACVCDYKVDQCVFVLICMHVTAPKRNTLCFLIPPNK